MSSKQQGFFPLLKSPENLLFCAQWVLVTSVGWALIPPIGKPGGENLLGYLLYYIMVVGVPFLIAFGQWLTIFTYPHRKETGQILVLGLLWLINIPIAYWLIMTDVTFDRFAAGALLGLLMGCALPLLFGWKKSIASPENLYEQSTNSVRLAWRLALWAWVIVCAFLLSQIGFLMLTHLGWTRILTTTNSRDVPGVTQFPDPTTVDSQGRTWIVDTNQHALQGYDLDGSQKTFSLGMVTDVVIDQQNRVWVSSFDGIFVLHPNGSRSRYTPSNSGLPYLRANALDIDAQGHVTIASDNGRAGESDYSGAISRVDPNAIMPEMNHNLWLISPSVSALLVMVALHFVRGRKENIPETHVTQTIKWRD